MSILTTGPCFTAELNLPANKAAVASTFKTCAGTNHAVGDAIPTCAEMNTAIAAATPAAQTLSIAGQTLSLSGGGGSVAVPSTAFATPAETVAGVVTGKAVDPAGLAAAIPAPVIITGSVAGVGVSFVPAGTYSSLAVAQTLTGETTTLTNTTNRPQLVTFTLNSEAIWYAPFAGSLTISYTLVINGVETFFSGPSRVPPHLHNDADNRSMTGVINHVLPANSSATFALREIMQEGNGFTVVVPANALLSYGGFVTYVQHSV